MISWMDFYDCAGPWLLQRPFSRCGEWGLRDYSVRASICRGFCLDHRLLGTPASLLHSTWGFLDQDEVGVPCINGRILYEGGAARRPHPWSLTLEDEAAPSERHT